MQSKPEKLASARRPLCAEKVTAEKTKTRRVKYRPPSSHCTHIIRLISKPHTLHVPFVLSYTNATHQQTEVMLINKRMCFFCVVFACFEGACDSDSQVVSVLVVGDDPGHLPVP